MFVDRDKHVSLTLLALSSGFYTCHPQVIYVFLGSLEIRRHGTSVSLVAFIDVLI